MKKIFYSLLLLIFTCTMPLQAQAENTTGQTMPSWEGRYCNQTTLICMSISEQGVDTFNNGGSYARVRFYTQKSSAFIVEGELKIESPQAGTFMLLHIVPSEDKSSMKVVESPYFKTWGSDSINNYGESLLLGNYFSME